MRKRTFKSSCLFLISVILCLPTVQAVTREDEDAFWASIDLLDLRMEMRALESLETAGFIITPARKEKYHKVQKSISRSLQRKQDDAMKEPDKWLQEQTKVQEGEFSCMLFISKYLMQEALKNSPEIGQEVVSHFENKYHEFDMKRAKNANVLAIFVEQQLETLHKYNLPDDAPANAWSMQDKQWRESVAKLYRGAMEDRKNVLQGIVKLEKKRMLVETSMKALGHLRKIIDNIELAQKSPKEHVEALVEKGVISYLKQKYGDLTEEQEANVKSCMGKVKDTIGKVWDTVNEVNALDQDKYLGRNPSALKLAKQFVMLGAVYEYTFGALKELKITKAIGPIFDVIDFYGQAIGLVPTFAKKMSKFVAETDQGARFTRAGDAFSGMIEYIDTKNRNTQEYWDTTLTDLYGVEIVTGEDREDTASPKFYLLIHDKSYPGGNRGFATMNKRQYLRLMEALADERIVNGHESSASLRRAAFANVSAWEAFWDQFIEHKNFETLLYERIDESGNVVSRGRGTKYVEALQQQARAVPFTNGQMLFLSQGRQVTLDDDTWDAESLASAADDELARMADEIAVREALNEFSPKYLKDWYHFKDIVLEKYKVALTPDQIIKMFNLYVRTGKSGKAEQILENLAKRREAMHQPEIKVEIPLVWIPDFNRHLYRGDKVKVQTEIVVSDLPPGESVKGTLQYEVPPWASSGFKTHKLTLRNGHHTFTRPLTVPEDAPRYPFKIKAILDLQGGFVIKESVQRIGIGEFRVIEIIESILHDLDELEALLDAEENQPGPNKPQPPEIKPPTRTPPPTRRPTKPDPPTTPIGRRPVKPPARPAKPPTKPVKPGTNPLLNEIDENINDAGDIKDRESDADRRRRNDYERDRENWEREDERADEQERRNQQERADTEERFVNLLTELILDEDNRNRGPDRPPERNPPTRKPPTSKPPGGKPSSKPPTRPPTERSEAFTGILSGRETISAPGVKASTSIKIDIGKGTFSGSLKATFIDGAEKATMNATFRGKFKGSEKSGSLSGSATIRGTGLYFGNEDDPRSASGNDTIKGNLSKGVVRLRFMRQVKGTFEEFAIRVKRR